MSGSLFSRQLKTFLESSSLSYRTNGRSYIFDCPVCPELGHGGSDKIYIRKDDGASRCWVCSQEPGGLRGGRPEFVLARLLQEPVGRVRARLYGFERADDEDDALSLDQTGLEDIFNWQPPPENELVLPVREWPFDYYPIDHGFSGNGREYLQGRGIDLALAQKYGVRYHPKGLRVVFPVSFGGDLYGWQGRYIRDTTIRNANGEPVFDKDGKPKKILKAKTSDGLPRERLVMFEDNLTDSDHCLLTEGPISAIKGDACGGNIATMGKTINRAQIEVIQRHGIKLLYLALDPDAAVEAQNLIREYDFEVRVLEIPPEKDLGDFSPGDALELFRHATAADRFRLFIHLKD